MPGSYLQFCYRHLVLRSGFIPRRTKVLLSMHCQRSAAPSYAPTVLRFAHYLAPRCYLCTYAVATHRYSLLRCNALYRAALGWLPQQHAACLCLHQRNVGLVRRACRLHVVLRGSRHHRTQPPSARTTTLPASTPTPHCLPQFRV